MFTCIFDMYFFQLSTKVGTALSKSWAKEVKTLLIRRLQA
jgi:hypothetical protein